MNSTVNNSIVNKGILILLLWLPLLSPADDLDHDDAYRMQQAGEILPLESILEKAKHFHDGKVLEVELEKKRGKLVYEVKILDNKGILWEMKLDATDGSMITEEKED